MTKPSDSYHTPKWIRKMFPTAFDPCIFNPDWNETHYDGLNDDWDGDLIFCNPPYSNTNAWVDRALEVKLQKNMMGQPCTIILLVPHDSSTKWYAKLHAAGARFLMFQGRLAFGTVDDVWKRAPFPSVMVVLS